MRPVIFGDIRDVTARSLRAALGRLPTVILGSPPCQSFSVVGAGGGLADPRGALFLEVIRLVEEIRPLWFALENVPGLVHRGLDRLSDLLGAAGYAVETVAIGADDLGAPHIRERLWICGGRRDVLDAGPPRIVDVGKAFADAAEIGRVPLWEPPRVGSGGALARRDEPFGLDPWSRPFLGPDADRAGLALDRRAAGRDRPTSIGVDWLDAWASWCGGCARHLRVAHGVESGVARPIIEAIGDSLLPEIAMEICKSMTTVVGPGEALELFAGGVGAWSAAARATGLEVIAASEVDPLRRAMWAMEHGGVLA